MNGSNRFAVTADHIFDGRTKHKNAAVVIEGSQIISLVPRSELTTDLSIQSLPVGFWLAPGFIDLQVNGGGDVLFNESPTPETPKVRDHGTSSNLDYRYLCENEGCQSCM
jgi:N-acetylglucosamine-6-phosphate deacetylase